MPVTIRIHVPPDLKRALDGELILYADADRKRGKLHDTLRDAWSDEQDLQVFFKWGNFEPTEGAEPE